MTSVVITPIYVDASICRTHSLERKHVKHVSQTKNCQWVTKVSSIRKYLKVARKMAEQLHHILEQNENQRRISKE
jgi:hypothetical protein